MASPASQLQQVRTELLNLYTSLNLQIATIMATQANIVTQISGVTTQLSTITTRVSAVVQQVKDLQAVIAAGPVTPELQASVDALASGANALAVVVTPGSGTTI